MPTRRDHLHAYRFQQQRALAALVTCRPDATEPPMRRLATTTLSGIMIAILVVAGVALVGVLDPRAGDAWRQPGTIIVERETGARFVLVDQVLHPVLNYTSAVLAVGTGRAPKVVLVDRDEIAGAERGPTIGIEGIPDSLPTAAALVHAPWWTCSQQRAAGARRVDAWTRVVLGRVDAAPVPARDAIVVRAASTSTPYLLYAGRRLAIGSSMIATSLGLPAQPLTVGTAFLAAVPAGPALRAPDLPYAGQRSRTSVAGRPALVGQLLHVTDDDTYLVVLADGVAPLTPVQTALLRTLPIGAGGRPVEPLDTSESTALALTPSGAGAAELDERLAGLPDRVPAVSTAARDAGGVCATFRPGEPEPAFAVPTSRRSSIGSRPVTESTGSRGGIADDVVLAPGAAALVRAAGGPSRLFLLADPGRRYPIGKRDAHAVLAGLGYGRATATTLPASLLSTLPTGPALDPAAARRAAGP